MNRVALLFANRTFGNCLARAVETTIDDYAVDVFSGVPVRHRVSLVRRGEYDLLVADEPIGNGPLASVLARALDVPFALVLRGWADLTNAHGEHGWLRDRSIAARTRWSTRVADALFVLSDVTRERLADRYPVERARTVGRPIPVSRYASNASDPARSRRDERVALTVTNLRYEGKFDGVRTILDGLKSLFERDDSLRYRIAGAGRYLPALPEHVAEYPYGERVDVLGWREDVPDLLSAADLFVYVSYLDSISTAVLEAQAAGLPVVAGDAVGVPTAVGNAGLLCDPTTAGVTDGVGRVLEDDSLRKRLAEQSRTKTAGYNVHAAREYVAVWNAVIDDHGTREEPNQAIISATAGRSDADDPTELVP
ncbi:glycosyl transferase family 1 [Halobacteriales archaeon QH_6_64_20]|nr:MAG: glycosyl transferase family 1 [Halobacteriales archaeon QH_6_64_20]